MQWGSSPTWRAVTPSRRTALASPPRRASRWGESTSLELDYLYQREDSIPDYGQPYFDGYPVSTSVGVPREAFYGVKGSDTERVNAHVATAQLQHRFGGGDNGPLLTNSLRMGAVDRFARPTAPRGLTLTSGSPTGIGRQRFETHTDNTYLANQTNLRGELQTGFLKHTANAGLELSWETRDQNRNNLTAVGLPSGPNLSADLFNPDPDARPLRGQPRLRQRQREQAVVGGPLRGGSAPAHPVPRGPRLRPLRRLRHPLRGGGQHTDAAPS